MIFTNRGRYRMLESVFRNTNTPTGFYLALCTAATTPTNAINTLGQLTQIAAGNGYSNGGTAVARNSTDFDVLTEDDSKQWALLQLKNFTFTASGGAIPISGDRARYAVLTDNNVTVANREVYCVFDLGAEDWAPSGDTIDLVDLTIRLRYGTGWTARGLKNMLGWFFRAATVPTNFYVALWTSATAPSSTTNLMSDGTQIATGNGYSTGGFMLNRTATDFDLLTENDTDDLALVQIKDVSWTASGGTIPPSGSGARYAILTDDNGTVASREVVAGFDLVSDRSASAGLSLNLYDMELQLTAP